MFLTLKCGILSKIKITGINWFYHEKKRNKILTHATTWMKSGNFILSDGNRDKRPHIVWFQFCEMSRTDRSIEIERLMVAHE